MDEISIIEVNAMLALVESTRLTENEITRLTKAGQNPQELCEYYDTTALLLGWRSEYDNDVKSQLSLLSDIAKTDDCEIVQPALSTPDVDIPVFAGGL